MRFYSTEYSFSMVLPWSLHPFYVSQFNIDDREMIAIESVNVGA